jgi:hypothetical protein
MTSMVSSPQNPFRSRPYTVRAQASRPVSARQQPGQRVSRARGERRRGALAQQPEPGQRPLTVPGHRIRPHRQCAHLDQIQTAETSGRYNAWIVAAYDPVQECNQVLSIAKRVPVLILNQGLCHVADLNGGVRWRQPAESRRSGGGG